MEEVGVGLVGFGLAGQVFHAPLIAATPGLRLRAIATSDPGRRRAAASRFPDSRLAADLRELLGSASDLQLLVLASPNRHHLPQALAALEAGLHLVVDKPLALSSQEAAQMIAAAHRRGLRLAVFQNRRWDDDFLLLRQVVDSGRLGRIQRLESRFERWRPELSPGSWREAEAPDSGGGLLLDLGTHLIDQALILGGAPELVYAEVRNRRGAAGDDDGFVSLTFPGGLQAHLWVSAVAAVAGPRLLALGTRGGLATSGLDPQEAQLRSGVSPLDPGFGRRSGREQWALWGGAGGDQQLAFPPGRYRDFYSGMWRALVDGTEVPVPGEDGLRTLEVVEAARESARRCEVVRLSASPHP
ncbi:MAG: Gfo/Idh/MocA family oxidoreductase [Candidatus Dormibacteraeota bacterium]|nr:Gfo/Idh/MocA family oxidoreductase [Candidatus Dormibacteraeota bacterium]